MNWRFKLSMRLALLRDIPAAVLALALAACGGDRYTTGVSAGSLDSATADLTSRPVARIVLSPATLDLAPGATRQVTASYYDAQGRMLYGRTSTWTSNQPGVATVSPIGIVTALAAGSALITATSGSASASMTTTVTDTSTAPAVASVTVSPASASIVAGATVQLSAEARTSAGAVITGVVLAWGSSNTAVATVSSTGLVRGIAAGTATISATVRGMTGSATITVTASGTTPPPTQPPPTGSNEPAGLTVISSRRFDAKVEDGWLDRGDAAFSIQSDAGALVSASNVGQALFRAGMAGGSGPINVRRELSGMGQTTLYVRFPFEVSANWQGHSTGVNKVFFIWIAGQPRVFFRLQGSGSGALYPRINLQGDPGNRSTLAANGDGAKQVVRGRWHLVEIQLTSNTSGNADGVVKLWVDGVLVSSHANVQFAAATEGHTWETLSWNPTWGGIGDTVAQDMWQRIDHVYLSGSR